MWYLLKRVVGRVCCLLKHKTCLWNLIMRINGKLYGAGVLNYSKIPTGDTISYGLDKYGNMCMIVNNKILGFYFGCILLGKYWLLSSSFHQTTVSTSRHSENISRWLLIFQQLSIIVGFCYFQIDNSRHPEKYFLPLEIKFCLSVISVLKTWNYKPYLPTLKLVLISVAVEWRDFSSMGWIRYWPKINITDYWQGMKVLLVACWIGP